MTSLYTLQQRVAAAVMQPLTRNDQMRKRRPDGSSMRAEAEALIKPNRLLGSFERLEIYNRQYWFRVLSCFAEDFPGLRAIVGARKFEHMARTYLNECPSRSFTLRNLGSRLERWLESNPKWIYARLHLALDMVRLEWAHIEAFDGGYETMLTPADIETAGLGVRLALQPYVRLLQLAYPVDDLLIEVHDFDREINTSSNAARNHQLRRRVQHFAQPQPESIYLAVHRIDDSVYYKRLPLESYRMLNALRGGKSLEQAIDFAFEKSSMPEEERISAVQEWFGNWAELGWFCRRISHTPEINQEIN